MNINPQDKALLITFSGAAVLIISFFFLGFQPFQNKTPEKYYEVPLVEEPQEQPEQKEHAEVEQPKEEMALTHRAVNSARVKRDADRFFSKEDEVREALQSERQFEDSPEESASVDNIEDYMTDYRGRIAALRQKEQQPHSSGKAKDAPPAKISSSSNRLTTISYNLVDRNSIKIPNPVYTCEATGKVVVNIEVGDLGNVIKATFNRASSTTTNGCLVDQALKYAGNAIFNAASRGNQLGTITFEFQG